jgi:peptidoglycan hydrolase-like protein with peptidoglycan-binding domain
MRRLLQTTALTALMIAGGPMAAMAEDLALVLGTERYDRLDRVPRAEDVVDEAQRLANFGFQVISLADGQAEATEAALADFLAAVPDAERVLVVLSGRFATDGSRTWYLTTDVQGPGVLSLGRDAIPVDSILEILARAQGRAVLMLGVLSDADTVFDPWLQEGLGEMTVPQGVTVLIGEPRVVSGFLGDEMTIPEGDLSALVRENGRIRAEGFLPAGFSFMPSESDAEIDVAPEPRPDAVDPAVEDALWEGTVALDTVEAYRNYLGRYPAGTHANAAQSAIEAILAEPNREDRLAEEALGLNRSQRRDIQRNLTLLSFNPRGIDGIFGAATRNAITNWQQQNGFEQTSYLSLEQIARIEAQAARRSAQLEAEAARQQQIAAEADRGFWDETGARGDEAGLRTYLNRYPDGLFADVAKEQLDEIETAKRQQAAVLDRSAWDEARQEDTVPAYRAYLRNFPEGAFQSEAEEQINRLRQQDAEGTARAAARATEQSLGLSQVTARSVEARLSQLGLEPGPVDGDFDQRTRRALRNYQRDRGLDVTGFLDENTLVRLLADSLANP